jgi:hypothetical protein
MPHMSALPFHGVEGPPPAAQGIGRSSLYPAKNYFDAARFFIRKAMAPGGVNGIFMALVLIVATDGLLLAMRSIQELPPVSLTFLIPIVVAAIRWGALSAAVTAVGGAASLTYLYVSPFYTPSEYRSRALGVIFFLVVSLVSAYLASRTRRDAVRALERENEIRDLYSFSSGFPPPPRRPAFSRPCSSTWERWSAARFCCSIRWERWK